LSTNLLQPSRLLAIDLRSLQLSFALSFSVVRCHEFLGLPLPLVTGSGAHPASCTMGTGGPFPGGKARPERDADHSPPSSDEVVNE
jgi:hypothetical protein